MIDHAIMGFDLENEPVVNPPLQDVEIHIDFPFRTHIIFLFTYHLHFGQISERQEFEQESYLFY